jgi:hypothetical protein
MSTQAQNVADRKREFNTPRQPSAGTITFTVHDVEGTASTYRSSRFPWEYKTFLAYVDPETGNYAYIPLANIDRFEVQQ